MPWILTIPYTASAHHDKFNIRCDTQLGATIPFWDVDVVAISAVPYSPERREETASTASIHACLERCWRHYTSSSTGLRRGARRWAWTRICRTCWPRSRLEQLGCCCNNLAEASWTWIRQRRGPHWLL